MMKVGFKQTIWQDFDIPEELEDEVREKIKSGEISSSDELHEFLENKDGLPEYEYSFDTATDMTVEQNGGGSTIELKEDGSIHPDWENGKP